MLDGQKEKKMKTKVLWRNRQTRPVKRMALRAVLGSNPAKTIEERLERLIHTTLGPGVYLRWKNDQEKSRV